MFFFNPAWMLVGLCFLILFSSPSYSVTFTSSTIIDWDNTLYEGQDIIIDGCTITINGEHSFNSLAIINSGVLKHSPAPNGEAENKLSLNIANDVTINSTSKINCDGLGYGAAKGPGAGGWRGPEQGVGGGGGHGGKGGNGDTSSYYPAYGGGTYGSASSPLNFGSGGGKSSAGGAGGGSIYLSIGGTLHLDGSISANGSNGIDNKGGGGGSGGSIWIITRTFEGTGQIASSGGSGTRYRFYHPYLDYYYAGGGGGGRIALYYDIKTYLGTTSVAGGAAGGSPAEAGGPGTIEYFAPPEQDVYGPIQPTFEFVPSLNMLLGKKIVFITHGWNGFNGNANHSWIYDMANEFQDYFITNEMSNTWTSYAYNWAEYAGEAGITMITAVENAKKIGNFIGSQLTSFPNCEHLHLIAHSAGAWMIDAISQEIKSNRPDISVQITFLDAYTPWGCVGVDSLGKYGDWVEHYVDHRYELAIYSDGEVIVSNLIRRTNATLKKAYNIDVTGSDPDDSKDGPAKWGLSSSLESGIIPGLEEMQQDFPRGGRENYPPSADLQIDDHLKEMVFNPTYWGTYAPNYSYPSDVEFDETMLIINSGEVSQASQSMGMIISATQTDEPIPTDISWFSIVIDANDPVNALSFESVFTSIAGAESILEVYWEDQLVGSIDERYVFDGIQEYIYFLPRFYQPGSYKLAFKLATYNNTVSSIEIDNVRLKVYRASYDLYPDNKIDFLDYAILAKEWKMEKMPQDIAPDEGDGIVNLLDFAVLASSWGEYPDQDMERLKDILENWLMSYELPISDISPYPNGDGIVDILDLKELAEHWLEGTSSF